MEESKTGRLALEELETSTGVVPECIVRVAVNDIIQPKFHGSAGIEAFTQAFLREAKLLAR